MHSSLAATLDHILAHEGGWANDPQDPGGCTMRGITLATYRAHGHRGATCADLRKSTLAEARRIYQVGYWAGVRGDDLPAGVDLQVCDHGVNAGIARGVALLRDALGAGPQSSLAKLVETARRVYLRDPAALVREVAARRERYYRGLAQFPRYGRGWLRRVAAAEAAARKLVAADRKPAQVAR